MRRLLKQDQKGIPQLGVARGLKKERSLITSSSSQLWIGEKKSKDVENTELTKISRWGEIADSMCTGWFKGETKGLSTRFHSNIPQPG